MPDALERFTTFYVRRPHPVFVRIEGLTESSARQLNTTPIQLKIEDLDHLTAYFETLKVRKEGTVGRRR